MPDGAGLLCNADFVRLWAAATISVFGSLVTRTALPWTAILWLDADASDVALLRAAEIAPAVALALAAGVWADRLRRRPTLIAADVARAALLLTVPAAAWLGALRLEHLFAVALAVGAFSVFFDVAHLAYLPTLVPRDRLAAANSRLSATGHAAEVGAFASGGFLVQLLGAPFALVVDAVSFVVSALLLARIRGVEPAAVGATGEGVWRELRAGVAAVLEHPLLRPLGIAALAQSFAFGLVGTVYLLYVTEELGFQPGALGLIFAVGGVSSIAGALVAVRAADALGTGRAIIGGLALLPLATLLLPLAPGATLVGAALLVGHQLGDGFDVVARVNEVSLRQRVTPDALLGRVNGSLHFATHAALLAGTLAGGWIGETAGLRATLVLAAGVALLGVVPVVYSPVRVTRA
jgi:MFS family permease